MSKVYESTIQIALEAIHSCYPKWSIVSAAESLEARNFLYANANRIHELEINKETARAMGKFTLILAKLELL